MQRYPVTIQMVVNDEEYFVWYALQSVMPYVTNAIIYDTGSSDRTVELIQDAIKRNPECKTEFKSLHLKRPHPLRELRQQQLQETVTPWFLLLDGDEIWPKDQLIKLLKLTETLPKDKLAVVNRTYNCTGDIWHKLPDSYGKYTFLNKTGHYTFRLMRTVDYIVGGENLDEEHYWKGKSVNSVDDWLAESDVYYLHTTHLKRSPLQNIKPVGRRKQVFVIGEPIDKKAIPDVLLRTKPDYVPDVTKHAGVGFLIMALFVGFVKKLYK